ncbi:MAG: hypothetical protein JWM47_2841 [Acidimicrobiales bacterium]|nr:hypothetical protein [Acidimicrobiales bacterium]
MSILEPEHLAQRYNERPGRLDLDTARWVWEHLDPHTTVPEHAARWDELVQPPLLDLVYQAVLWAEARNAEMMGRFAGGQEWERERRAGVRAYGLRLKALRTYLSDIRIERREAADKQAAAERRAERAASSSPAVPAKAPKAPQAINVVDDGDKLLHYKEWSRNYGRLSNYVEEHRTAVLAAGEPGDFDLILWQQADALQAATTERARRNRADHDAQTDEPTEPTP